MVQAKKFISLVLVGCFVCPPPNCRAGDPIGGIGKGVSKALRAIGNAHDRKRPDVLETEAIRNLAGEIDWLEHHLDRYGSIVPKQPDVWGEARMTSHRRDVEEQLAKRKGEFSQGIQGALGRSDTASLALAFAIGAAAGDRAIPASQIGGELAGATSKTEIKETETKDGAGVVTETSTERSTTNASPTAYLPSSEAVKFDQRSSDGALQLEPVIHNEQLFRYLNALNALRRINEGDDNSDTPGYSLNLIRVPVSILPGKNTQSGYAAELSLTAEAVLGPDLLPSTFRQMVLHDIVDMVSLPITNFLGNDPRSQAALAASLLKAEQEANLLADKMLRRLEKLRLEEGPELGAIAKFFSENFEYFRKRYIEIALLSIQAENEIAQRKKDDTWRKESQFLLSSTSVHVYQDVEYCVELSIGATQILNALSELFDYGVSVQPVTVELIRNGLTTKFEYPVLIYEQELSEVQPGELPYKACLDLECFAVANEAGGPSLLKDSMDFDKKVANLLAMNVLPPKLYEEFLNRRSKDYSILERLRSDLPKGTFTALFGSENPSKHDYIKFFRNLAEFQLPPVYGSSIANLFRGVLTRLEKGNYRNLFSILTDASQAAYSGSRGMSSLSAPMRNRRSLQPIPPSLFEDVFGYEFLSATIQASTRSLHMMPPNRDTYVHLTDVRGILFDELSAAYDMLSRPEMLPAWDMTGPAIANAIHGRQFEQLRFLRDQYYSGFERGQRSNLSVVLSWAIMVQSALLDEHLRVEMERQFTEVGSSCMAHQVPFFGPNPSQEARDAFNEYVRIRWPIQIFALDPVTQDQNIDDRFDAYRSLQIAAAAALANGHANMNATANFMRKMELNMNTIALNRTAVGFSHDRSTFGWRFYPRMQSPDTATPLQAFGQTLFGGPDRKTINRDRMLEPGIRECTAIVIMPSFVPYIAIQSRSSWINLNNPASRELTVSDAMRLSAACAAIERQAACVQDSNCYLPGERSNLDFVFKQVCEKLPIKTKLVPIPNENSLGGFQVFSSSSSELGVELIGWYGAPGIRLGDEKNTTLFLVGKGFSLLETKVIAGGVGIQDTRLLSREILQVKIPGNVATLLSKEHKDLVDIHVATPYGVSSHLLIPAFESNPPKVKPEVSWKSEKLAYNGTIGKLDDVWQVRELTIGSGNPLQIKMKPAELSKQVKQVQVELLVATPAGVGWAPGFKKEILLEVKESDEGELTITDAAVSQLQAHVGKALNSTLKFEKCPATPQFVVNLFLRVTVPSSGESEAIVGKDHLHIQATLISSH